VAVVRETLVVVEAIPSCRAPAESPCSAPDDIRGQRLCRARTFASSFDTVRGSDQATGDASTRKGPLGGQLSHGHARLLAIRRICPSAAAVSSCGALLAVSDQLGTPWLKCRVRAWYADGRRPGWDRGPQAPLAVGSCSDHADPEAMAARQDAQLDGPREQAVGELVHYDVRTDGQRLLQPGVGKNC